MDIPSSAKAISAQIRATLLLNGLSRHDLAKATGLDADNVTNIIGGNNVGEAGRALIEAALDKAFWTDPFVFAQRRAMRPFYGGDFAAANALHLDSEAGERLPIRRRGRTRAELLRRFGITLLGHSAPAHAQAIPPQRGEDGGASADLPPTPRADLADPPIHSAIQP